MDEPKFMTRADRDELYELSANIKRIADTLMPISVHSREVDAAFVRSIVRARRLRDEYLGADLFADPAWDMMLDLLAARFEGRRVSVSSLCIAAAVPATTALRWISVMERQGVIVRHADPGDGRRVHLALADAVAGRLIAFLKMSQSVTAALM
jgi:hypothetical protein